VTAANRTVGTDCGYLRRMDPVEHTPTEPVDYAAISATYGALLASVVLAARDRGEDEIPASELPALAAATFALSKLVAKEKAETWMREPFVDETAGRPKGRRLRYAVGELLTCTRCVGAWSSLGLVALRVTRPREARVVTTVLATSALNDFLHAGFAALCARSEARPSPPPPRPAPAPPRRSAARARG
jgi:hypothetical protein